MLATSSCQSLEANSDMCQVGRPACSERSQPGGLLLGRVQVLRLGTTSARKPLAAVTQDCTSQ